MKSPVDLDLLVYFEGGFHKLQDAKVGILTHALHYGTGVFEGIRGFWVPEENELFLFRPLEHYERFRHNTGIVRIQLPFTPSELCDLSAELIARNELRTDIYVRPLAYKSGQRIGIHFGPEDDFALIVVPFGEYIDSSKGLHVGVSSWRRIEDNSIPSRGKICGAYVNSALSGDEARRNGFDEAILLNEHGHVAEGSASNLFMVRHGKLITPPVYENILEGITRDTIMRLAREELGMAVEERPVDRTELYICDELFFCGTAFELAAIISVDHRVIGNGAIGPAAEQLRQLYRLASHARLARYRHWCFPVYQRVLDARRERIGASRTAA